MESFQYSRLEVVRTQKVHLMICLVLNYGALAEFQKYKVSMLLDNKGFEKHTDDREFEE